MLVKDLKTHYPQWNIHPFNSKPLNGVILVGVGAGTGDYTNKYTTNLYKKVLNEASEEESEQKPEDSSEENILDVQEENVNTLEKRRQH